jgi:hypothetical protein
MQWSTMQWNSMECNAMQWNAMEWNDLIKIATSEMGIINKLMDRVSGWSVATGRRKQLWRLWSVYEILLTKRRLHQSGCISPIFFPILEKLIQFLSQNRICEPSDRRQKILVRFEFASCDLPLQFVKEIEV